MTRTLARLAGFSLVEVTLALGIAAFALMAVFALLPIGFATSRDAGEQTRATNVFAAVAGDLRATAGSATTSPTFGIAIPPNTGSSTVTLFFTATGEYSSSLDSNSRYRATIAFAPNPAGANGATFANVSLSWPAAAGAENASGTIESFVALTRN